MSVAGPPLWADVGPAVLDERVVCARVEIGRVDRKPAEAAEAGTVELKVREVLRGPLPETVVVSFARPVTPGLRNDVANLWSELPLETGRALLAALEPRPAGGWLVVAAVPLETAEAPAVAGLREAVRIEALDARGSTRRAPLQKALASPEDVLRRYALRAVATCGLFARDESVDMHVGAAQAAGTDAIRFEIASHVAAEPLFLPDAWADRANALILRVLVRGLARAAAGERLRWARALAGVALARFSSDPAESERIRRALILEADAAETVQVLGLIEGLGAPDVFGALMASWRGARAAV